MLLRLARELQACRGMLGEHALDFVEVSYCFDTRTRLGFCRCTCWVVLFASVTARGLAIH